MTDDDIATYRRDGLVVPSYRLSDDMLSDLRETVDQVLADNPDIRPEHLMNAHLERRDGHVEGIRGGKRIFKHATNPDLLDVIEQVIGPDVILWGCHLFCKPAKQGMEVPWHQDGHYWPIRPLATCTAWIAIDDATPVNGCMRYIPGSHARGLVRHHTEQRENIALSEEIDREAIDEWKARDNVLTAGQVSLHDVFLFHCSSANRSGKRRAGLAVRYMPATSHFDRNAVLPSLPGHDSPKASLKTRPIWLLRGVNRNPSNDLEVGHDLY